MMLGVLIAMVWTLSAHDVSVRVDGEGGTMAVTDGRIGRTYESLVTPWSVRLTAKDAKLDEDGRTLRVLWREEKKNRDWSVGYRLDENGELTVVLKGDGPMDGWIMYPLPFVTTSGDRMIIPENEGMGYPVDDKPFGAADRYIAYKGYGACMAFVGVVRDADGSGWMEIAETADDASFATAKSPQGCYTITTAWEPADAGQSLGYARKLRYVFLREGGHVAMAKRYRRYIAEKGGLVTFAEKAKVRPNVMKLLGAANVWTWDNDRRRVAQLIESIGITHYLWSAAGEPEFVNELAKRPNVLVGKYDLYQDIYYPELCRKMGWKSGWNTDAWPDDVQWYKADSNCWQHAWALETKDGLVPSAAMCDLCAPPRARRRIAEELRKWNWTARFIDTTTAAEWKFCRNPRHPMTRRESRASRIELLGVMSVENKLVTGSEAGHDAAIAVCDYFEGMNTIGRYNLPRAGRDVAQIWTNAVPENTIRYQVNEKYRLPLWELVYHDCCAAHHYWGDANNKVPSLWRKHDLIDALYGLAPLYVISAARWEIEKGRFAESYRLLEPIARKTATSEMTGHEFLTPDRTVQRTTFSNGVRVTVDFARETCEVLTLP